MAIVFDYFLENGFNLEIHDFFLKKEIIPNVSMKQKIIHYIWKKCMFNLLSSKINDLSLFGANDTLNIGHTSFFQILD